MPRASEILTLLVIVASVVFLRIHIACRAHVLQLILENAQAGSSESVFSHQLLCHG